MKYFAETAASKQEVQNLKISKPLLLVVLTH